MALLSAFLTTAADAQAALAVDHDPRIIQAATIVSKVLGAGTAFNVVDFDSENNWEDTLNDFSADIVFALNVLN